jgi:hypothetical protein
MEWDRRGLRKAEREGQSEEGGGKHDNDD